MMEFINLVQPAGLNAAPGDGTGGASPSASPFMNYVIIGLIVLVVGVIGYLLARLLRPLVKKSSQMTPAQQAQQILADRVGLVHPHEGLDRPVGLGETWLRGVSGPLDETGAGAIEGQDPVDQRNEAVGRIVAADVFDSVVDAVIVGQVLEGKVTSASKVTGQGESVYQDGYRRQPNPARVPAASALDVGAVVPRPLGGALRPGKSRQRLQPIEAGGLKVCPISSADSTGRCFPPGRTSRGLRRNSWTGRSNAAAQGPRSGHPA
mgnify:CR=1 FL=1